MGVRIRLADLIDDRPAIIAGMRDHLNQLTDQRRYDWLFLENPDGKARIWVAEEDASGQIVGSTGLLPRMLYVDGRKVLGCVVADTWIHPDHRVLGPAMKLLRACIEDVQSSGFYLAYDFPRQAMPAIYKRLKLIPADALIDFVRLLRFDSFLENRLSMRLVRTLLTKSLNPLVRIASLPRRVRGVSFGIETDRCGEEYTLFHQRTCGNEVCVARTDEYLNWRYHDHFHKAHHFMVARRGDELAGYIVFVPGRPRASIVDFVCEDDVTLRAALLGNLFIRLIDQGCDAVSCSTLDSGSLAKLLGRSYFRREGATPLVIIPGDTGKHSMRIKLGNFQIGQEAD